jgi:molecular chaperone GrpE
LKKDIAQERPAASESDAGAETKAETTDQMKRLEDAEKKAAENYDKYLRVVADMENYKKRSAKERADSIKYANENLIRDILPFVDSMDRALEHASNSDDFEAFKEGLKLVQDQLFCCLEKHGVVKIDAKGKDFDPNFHDAMLQVEGKEHEDNKVASEFEKGYLLHGRLLRPSKVSVCKCPTKKTKHGDPANSSKE